MDESAILNAAVGVEAIMAKSYTPGQAVDMCRTASLNPGVAVAFDMEDGGKATVTYQGYGDLHTWAVERGK